MTFYAVHDSDWPADETEPGFESLVVEADDPVSAAKKACDIWLSKGVLGSNAFDGIHLSIHALDLKGWVGLEVVRAPKQVWQGDGSCEFMPGIYTNVMHTRAPNTEMIDWAVSRWNAEVSARPLRNVHRRSLDDVWRQVLRRLGADPDTLLGPSHDELRRKHGLDG